MAKFKDERGREWDVAINVAVLRRVQRDCEIDLLGVLDGELAERLSRDPILLCDVLCSICSAQAQELGVSDEQFGESLAGDSIENAAGALLDAIMSFYPSPRGRKSLGRVIETAQRVRDRGWDLIDEKIESGEMAIAIEAELRGTLGGSSGSAPESSGSTQARSPSGS